ncbi:MAG: HAD hydrolase family protein [Oscillospiraceae bacterium]|nr:HAD hydrolase family protein [Oscillospiraceae bacterium]
MKNLNLPPVGARILKSTAGVVICYIIYILRGNQGTPFYSMLAVLWCLQPYSSRTLTMALQRTIGTLIGVTYGLITLLLEIYVLRIYNSPAGYIFTSLMIIPVLYTTVLMKKKNASYFSCVVFLSIAVIHISDANPFIFVANRFFETFSGIAIGGILNSESIIRKKDRETLFAAEFDDLLNKTDGRIDDYTQIELNRMLEEKMKFTLTTMRTPATLISELGSVNLNMPVIVMNGAALYDIKNNTYSKAYIISNDTCTRIRETAEKCGMNCFTNVLSDDTLMILYDRLINEAEKSIYSSLRKSPLRNYINREPLEQENIIYMMIIDKTEKTEMLCSLLDETGENSRLKIVTYPSDEYQGYSYIKIYNKNVSKENMIRKLMEENGISEYKNISDNSEKSGGRSFIKKLKKQFEPGFIFVHNRSGK